MEDEIVNIPIESFVSKGDAAKTKGEQEQKR
jgi:hypothetical protein